MDRGAHVPIGTTIVGAADRVGSSVAVAYPLGDRTIIFCSSDTASKLAPIEQPRAVSGDEFVEAASALGGAFVGAGDHCVLDRDPITRPVDGLVPVDLDRDAAADRARIAAFVAACPEDDLDEAELAMDELDPAIVALVDSGGAIASYASGRPWQFDDDFDDIAVITNPARRGRGLGSAVVAELAVRRRRQGRQLFYGYNVDNAGSKRVARAAGFDVVCTVSAVDFD